MKYIVTENSIVNDEVVEAGMQTEFASREEAISFIDDQLKNYPETETWISSSDGVMTEARVILSSTRSVQWRITEEA